MKWGLKYFNTIVESDVQDFNRHSIGNIRLVSLRIFSAQRVLENDILKTFIKAAFKMACFNSVCLSLNGACS